MLYVDIYDVYSVLNVYKRKYIETSYMSTMTIFLYKRSFFHIKKIIASI